MENWYHHAEHYFRVMKERLATMSRYFFHLYTESSVEQDTVGVEFPSLEAAIEDAEQARCDYLREEIKAPRAQRQCRFEITDKEGQVVAMVPPANF